MKKNSGITLIALIITIIIMLILVAVTVSIMINSGIIGKAQKAKQDTTTAYERESTLGDSLSVNGTMYNSIDEYLDSQREKTDLEKLKEYFVGKSEDDVLVYDEINNVVHGIDMEPIPDASQSIIMDGPVIVYNNVKYYLIGDEDKTKPWLCTNVIDLSKDVIVCTMDGGELIFTPKDNQTWYEWANDPDDINNIDIKVNSINTTLKDFIIMCYNDNGINGDIKHSMGTRGARLTRDETIQKCSDKIIPGYYSIVIMGVGTVLDPITS